MGVYVAKNTTFCYKLREITVYFEKGVKVMRNKCKKGKKGGKKK